VPLDPWYHFARRLVCLLGLVIPCSALSGAVMEDVSQGQLLASRLGCAQCHTELAANPALRDATPDLSSAGLRYQPAWLFEFLRHPTRIRQHLGPARMPAFSLTDKEALALTAFLEAQRHVAGTWPALPAEVMAQAAARQPVSKEQFQAELARGFICLSCHDYAGQGGHRAVEFTNVSLRLRPEWVARYLVAPDMFGVPATTMPPQFYHLTADRSAFREVMPGAARTLQQLRDHLFSLNESRRGALESGLATARQAHPGITVAQGETLFRALNCAACHRHHEIHPKPTNAAPSLIAESARVGADWLQSFLEQPVPVRPFGNVPGDGSRMPNFSLATNEVRDLSAFLLAPRPDAALKAYVPATRSAFALSKASSLFADKLSCLGCHRLGERGGRIGPDLTRVRQRLQPGYVLNIIRDPRGTAPHSIMPRAPVTEDTARLIADYLLLQPATPAQDEVYLSPLDHPVVVSTSAGVASLGVAQQNYSRHCAACHGAGGQGDGYNAAFLPTRPTRHADATAMRGRPDDTLFDGIHAGGSILNKSPFMPGWGESFTTRETRDLVAYIRTLCRCEGPAWSRDGTR